ncbi:MAG: PqqD family protein [Oscillospiraceae bacterium]|nr:PqqD family protein [Oscillospiraceae bacterium]
MEIKKQLMKRQVAGETFLVPLGKAVYDSNGLFFLTEVGAFLWDLLEKAESEEELVAAVLAEYDVDEATARADINAFLTKLREMGIL